MLKRVKNKLFVIGHTLVWHNPKNTPSWIFVDSIGQNLTREALLKRMEELTDEIVEEKERNFEV